MIRKRKTASIDSYPVRLSFHNGAGAGYLVHRIWFNSTLLSDVYQVIGNAAILARSPSRSDNCRLWAYSECDSGQQSYGRSKSRANKLCESGGQKRYFSTVRLDFNLTSKHHLRTFGITRN